MEKTKIGISIGLVGAAAYFFGMFSTIPLVLLTGYILLREDNVWLKRQAVKAVGIVLFFFVILTFFSMFYDVISLLNELLLIIDKKSKPIDFGTDFNRILLFLQSGVRFAQTLILIMCGFKALGGSEINFGPVDKLIDAHFIKKETPVANQ